MNVKITGGQCYKLKIGHILFLKKGDEAKYDDDGEIYFTWSSTDRDLNLSLDSEERPGNEYISYGLVVIDNIEIESDQEKSVTIDMHFARFNNENDWLCIFNSLIIRSQNCDDKYFYMELLWFLDKMPINAILLANVINKYPQNSISIIVNTLKKIGRCLSFYKQKCLFEVLKNIGLNYNIYVPHMLVEAYQQCYPEQNSLDKLNLFEITDRVLDNSTNLQDNNIINYSNPLLALKQWFYTEEKFQDYSELKYLFAIVAESKRLNMVKRYFHDIRIGNTSFDINLLRQFKDNKYIEFIRYRYCLETPSDSMILTVPLLCDSIITLYDSQGEEFQSFEGVLDFAMTHCNVSFPIIDFQLNRFLPQCDKAAIYNTQFIGFIDYALVREIDLDKFNEESINNVIRNILDKYCIRETYPVCSYKDKQELPTNILEHCKALGKDKNGVRYKCDCLKQEKYDDRWTVFTDYEKVKILNSFLSKELAHSSSTTETITFDMTSHEVLKDFVLSAIKEYESISENIFVIPSYTKDEKTYELGLIEKFTKIIKMRIFPQEGIFAGPKFDVFGIWKRKIIQYSQEQMKDKLFIKLKLSEYQNEEALEVKRRTIEALREELNTEILDDKYFEIEYDRKKLNSLIHKFYYKRSSKPNTPKYNREFLTRYIVKGQFTPYCAPQISPINNPAIDLPYFWCRGRECFHNNLGDQTLKECKEWKNYSLYHMIEIIGLPKLYETDAGYEADSIVRIYIAVINKVMQKFIRLKCRSCGHMMFADKRGNFNRHNYYSCSNPMCPEFNKSVYLNYCFHCKNGLIDSRDSKQCPNGWYICPTCFSCCNDEIYERMAQKYEIINRTIPNWIKKKLGQGHNDKGQYFCPDCGSPMKIIEENINDKVKMICTVCKKEFYIEKTLFLK